MKNLTSDEWHRDGEHLSHKGFPIFYRRSAPRDEFLLCLHGFPTSSFDYRKVWEPLAERFCLIAIDLVGYGFSAKPREFDYTTFAQADLVQDVLEQLDIDRVHVLSHDYGNTIMQELLAREAERRLNFAIESLCFLNGALFPETHRPILAQKILISPLGRLFGRFIADGRFKSSLASIFGPESKPTSEELNEYATLFKHNKGKLIAHKLIRYMRERSVHRERWVPPLRRMTQPFMFINGTWDPVSGKHLVDRFREVVPLQKNIVELDGIGHFPHLESPETVVRHLLEFQRELRGGA